MNNCPICTKWEDDSHLRIAGFKHCHVTLNSDQFFPGYSFVFTREHVTELFHLEQNVRSEIIEEVNAVAAALSSLFKPAKINYELLGNMVPHMHWHIIPRFVTDPLWPRPIWSEQHEPLELSPEGYAERISLIQRELEIT